MCCTMNIILWNKIFCLSRIKLSPESPLLVHYIIKKKKDLVLSTLTNWSKLLVLYQSCIATNTHVFFYKSYLSWQVVALVPDLEHEPGSWQSQLSDAALVPWTSFCETKASVLLQIICQNHTLKCLIWSQKRIT